MRVVKRRTVYFVQAEGSSAAALAVALEDIRENLTEDPELNVALHIMRNDGISDDGTPQSSWRSVYTK